MRASRLRLLLAIMAGASLVALLVAWRRTRQTRDPDRGAALVELLARVGDALAAYQDAVAGEAHLETCGPRVTSAGRGKTRPG